MACLFVADAGTETESENRRIFTDETTVDRNKLFECLEEDLFCDAILIADDGKRIPVHRNVLYAANDYFRAMFAGGMKERGQLEIKIGEVDGDILERLFKYCHTGVIAIDLKDLDSMTQVANMLQFTKVKEHCAAFYSTILCASNCLGIREVAELHNMVQLKTDAHALALDQFMEVSKSNEFRQLSADQLSTLLKEDEINVSAEEDVFNALIQWIKYDVEERKKSLGTLLDCIRFKHIKESFLLKEIVKRCIELKYPGLVSSIFRSRLSEDQNENPRPSSKSQFHLVFENPAGIQIDRYCNRKNKWLETKRLTLDNKWFSVVYRRGNLISIGGRNASSQPSKIVKSIDLKTHEVVDLPEMTSARLLPSAALLNDSIYVFGSDMEEVEKYDFEKNEWTEVTPMSTARFCPAHVVTSGRLFVFGGRKWSALKSVEYYEPSANKWQTVAPMLHERRNAATCASNGFIYVLGGCYDWDALQSIERYDLRENAWTEMNFRLSVPRYWYSSGISIGDWICLAGGRDDYDKTVGAFEKMNVITGEVVKLKELRRPTDRCHLFTY